MKKKSVILLSAGLDSSVNFYIALQKTEVVLALTFDYGQKAATKEIEKSKILCEINKIQHQVIEVPWLKNLGQSSLTQSELKIPQGSEVSIADKNISLNTAKSVWVPNRNGLFLNIAASFAESLKADMIIPGFNAEEAATFPDNSFEFLKATQKTFFYSTQNHIDVQCYTIDSLKKDIVKLGIEYKVPFEKLWFCYQNKDKWCGQCESCLRAYRAFSEEAQLKDILKGF